MSISWLEDPIFAVREAAADNFKKYIETFGIEWGQNNVIPNILNLHSDEFSGNRITVLRTIQHILPTITNDVVDETILPIVLRMVADAIPNVRLNVCKVLIGLSTKCSESALNDRIKPAISRLCKDTDNDVLYFANLALNTLS